jgi:hypothetical protein
VGKADFPVHSHKDHGNVFNWIIKAAEDFRKIRRQERFDELEKRQNDDQRNAEL